MKFNKSIYVVAPARHKTGGTELAHQLVKTYVDNGVNAIIAYVGVSPDENPINEAFFKYTNRWIAIEDIKDIEDNIIIVPEIYTEILLKYRKAYKIIWWMSVDFFEKNNGYFGAIKYFGLLRPFVWCVKGVLHNKMPSIRVADLHLYQSEYAKLWLENKKINNLMKLSDYINDSYFVTQHCENSNNEREKYVLYNPKKGYEFTKKIILATPQFKWVPIQNMTTEEVGELLRKSRVYIDFGNHPGKDRFPREAAISGCCIITGLRGAANNDEDICIPHAYKFKDKKTNIKRITLKIQDCLNNYEERLKDFEMYRIRIEQEKSEFKINAMEVIAYLQKVENNELKKNC